MSGGVGGGCPTRKGEMGAVGDSQAGRASKEHSPLVPNLENRSGPVTGTRDPSQVPRDGAGQGCDRTVVEHRPMTCGARART